MRKKKSEANDQRSNNTHKCVTKVLMGFWSYCWHCDWQLSHVSPPPPTSNSSLPPLWRRPVGGSISQATHSFSENRWHCVTLCFSSYIVGLHGAPSQHTHTRTHTLNMAVVFSPCLAFDPSVMLSGCWALVPALPTFFQGIYREFSTHLSRHDTVSLSGQSLLYF